MSDKQKRYYRSEKGKATARRYREKHPERMVAAQRAWGQRQVDKGMCIACGRNPLILKSDRKYSRCQECRIAYRRNALVRNYGVTLEEYFSVLEKQDNKCAICNSPEKLCIDHDHITGKFRGILCKKCNVGIGALGDTAEGLRRALKYLEG